MTRKKSVTVGLAQWVRIALTSLVGIFCCANLCQAANTTYYVDRDSLGGACSDSANSGTSTSQPWCTIYQANRTLTEGDIVYIRKGAYQIGNTVGDGGSSSTQGIAPVNSGTSNSPITYSAYPGEQVDFVGISDGSTTRAIGIDLDGKSYVHVTGYSGHNMTFTKMTMNLKIGYNVPGSYNEIDHCDFGTFYPTDSPNFRGATIQHGSQYNYLHDCALHDWQMYTVDSDGPVCLEIGEENGTDPTSYNVIERNEFYHCGHHLVGVAGIYNVFRNNVLHNEDHWVGVPVGEYTGTQYGYRNIQLGTGMSGSVGNHLVEGNRIGPSGISMKSWYCDGQSGRDTQRGGTSLYVNSSNNLIRYNIVFGAQGMAMHFRRYTGGEVKYNYTYNNTFYHTGYSLENDINCDERYPVYFDDESGYNEYNVVKNSLFRSTWPQTTLDPQTVPYGGDNCPPRPATPVVTGILITATVANNYESSEASNTPFVNTDMSDVYSLTLPDLSLIPSATDIIDRAGCLTLVDATDSGSGTTLKIVDARYFSDGKFGKGIEWPSHITNSTTIQADYIVVGQSVAAAEAVQIASISDASTIILTRSVPRTTGDCVWLFKDSSGKQVLYGVAPDFGAYEYSDSNTTPAASGGSSGCAAGRDGSLLLLGVCAALWLAMMRRSSRRPTTPGTASGATVESDGGSHRDL